MFDFFQNKKRYIALILVLGITCVSLSIWGRLTFAASNPKGIPGSYLSLTNYVTAQNGDNPEELVGAYLGPYSVSVNYCETFHIVGEELQCYHSDNGELKLDPENVTASGYGLLLLRYPDDMCEGGGICYATPTIMLLIPQNENSSWRWKLYRLTGSNGVSGQEWGPRDGFRTYQGNVKMKTMLVDYNSLFPPG